MKVIRCALEERLEPYAANQALLDAMDDPDVGSLTRDSQLHAFVHGPLFRSLESKVDHLAALEAVQRVDDSLNRALGRIPQAPLPLEWQTGIRAVPTIERTRPTTRLRAADAPRRVLVISTDVTLLDEVRQELAGEAVAACSADDIANVIRDFAPAWVVVDVAHRPTCSIEELAQHIARHVPRAWCVLWTERDHQAAALMRSLRARYIKVTSMDPYEGTAPLTDLIRMRSTVR